MYETLKLPDPRLRPHPRNPRRGNLSKIKSSLLSHGQYKPIVVNRNTGHILAGNHTYQAICELGLHTVEVRWVEVDPDEEMRILLADNATSDDATYDQALLDAIIEELEQSVRGLEGTGFEGLALQLEEHPPSPPDLPPPRPSYTLIVECEDALQRQALKERLEAEGLRVQEVA